MGLFVNLEDLLEQNVVESSRIEWKSDFNPAPILHTLCAFANDIDNIGGGYLVIGIEEENGRPKYPLKGLDPDHADSIMKKLRELCLKIEPVYQPLAEPVVYQNKTFILIWAAGGKGRPYCAPEDPNVKGSLKNYYIRKFSSSVIASREEQKELFQISEDIPYDDQPNLLSSLNDLDRGLILEHLQRMNSTLYQRAVEMPIEELADSMQLLSGPPEHRVPRNVGILFFSNRIHEYFPYAKLEVVYIPDPAGEMIQVKTFTGPVQNQLLSALEYIKTRYLEERILKIKGQADAEHAWNYPYEALEEILTNAVYHRDYRIHEPVSVRITQEGMEITSFPGFHRSITDINIQNGNFRARVYRNRRIGDLLKELRLIEGQNTGFPNAQQALKQNGSGQLKIEMNPERDYLSVCIPVHPLFLPSGKRKSQDDVFERKILDVLEKKHPMSISEISREMGYKAISSKLRNAVKKLTAADQLEASFSTQSRIVYSPAKRS